MIGNAERALELMVSRVKSRVAFGGPLVSQVVVIDIFEMILYNDKKINSIPLREASNKILLDLG